ncbi:hypothetical protein L0222_25760 [bacterium]|nr:hypothetical protein [bacterium]
MQKLDRKFIVRKTFEESKKDNSFVEGSMSERVSQVWELTKNAWAMTGINAEQRLQRHLAVLIRRKR